MPICVRCTREEGFAFLGSTADGDWWHCRECGHVFSTRHKEPEEPQPPSPFSLMEGWWRRVGPVNLPMMAAFSGWQEVRFRDPGIVLSAEIFDWIEENGHSWWASATVADLYAVMWRRFWFADQIDAVFFKLRWYEGA